MKMKTQYIPTNIATSTTNDNLGELYTKVVLELERIERGVSHENPETMKKLHAHLRKILFS